MKKQTSLLMTIAILMVCFSSVTFAMNGKGAGSGSGPLLLHTIVSTFSYEGVITSAGVPGDGVEISTADGLVTVYGLGPSYFWESLGLDKLETLAVGAAISVTGIVVDYNGELRSLVTTLTVDGLTLDLRDPATGVPLWR